MTWQMCVEGYEAWTKRKRVDVWLLRTNEHVTVCVQEIVKHGQRANEPVEKSKGPRER